MADAFGAGYGQKGVGWSMGDLDGVAVQPQGQRDRSKAERAARIRAAAEELLSESNFEDITTKRVAERAGIGEATLFRYIKSKQRLLNVVYGDQMDAMLNATEERDIANTTATPVPQRKPEWYVDRIYASYQARCEFYLRNPHNATLYLRAGFDPTDDLMPRHLAQGDRTIRLVAAILSEGQRAGMIRTDVDPALVAQNCHGIFIHEVDRTPVRGFLPESIWERVCARLRVQLMPLIA